MELGLFTHWFVLLVTHTDAVGSWGEVVESELALPVGIGAIAGSAKILERYHNSLRRNLPALRADVANDRAEGFLLSDDRRTCG